MGLAATGIAKLLRIIRVVFENTGCCWLWWSVSRPGPLLRHAAYDDENLVTALVPSDTACLDSSPGSMRRTAVWISRDERVACVRDGVMDSASSTRVEEMPPFETRVVEKVRDARLRGTTLLEDQHFLDARRGITRGRTI